MNCVIERGSEILQDISGQQTEIIGDACLFGEIVDYLSSLRITLMVDAIRLRPFGGVKESINGSIELRDVLLGPLDLCFGTVHIPPF